MKPIEGEEALLLHLREIGGRESIINLSSVYRENLSVSECNLFGEDLPTGDIIEIKPWENKFVKVK